MGKQIVKISRLNWDVAYYVDITRGRGFTISEPAVFNIDESKQKSMYGARSPLYGTSYEDETAFIERTRCQCGEFKGRLFEGETCPLCHTKVESRDIDINYTGWITLGANYVINPYYYNRIADCIGKNALADIVNTRMIVDVDGHMHFATLEELEKTAKRPLSKHPFVGIGLIEFRKRFNEIMDWFKAKKKKKDDEFERLKKSATEVFTSHIPIYSTFLRPQSSTADTYYYNSIDKHINPLFSLSEKIKNCEEIDKHYILGRIQFRVNSLWDENFKLLNGKEGWIRGQILGGALNFTSRNVIIPGKDLRDDEVDLSYHTFRELFKFKIIYYLSKMDNGSLAKAYTEWYNSGHKFSKRVYEVMMFILKQEQSRIIMNRNPTLNYYSMLLMRIRQIKQDMEDYTLTVPIAVLPGLNADFDGDILNIIAMVSKEMVYAFRKYDPISRMMISRDNGLLNDYFALSKGHLIDLYNFATL